MMTCKTFPALLLFFSLLLPSIAAEKNTPRKRPNIILVFIDDMGWSDLSCFGGKEKQTPNIDALAREGIRFGQFYVNSPICSPSRVAITTGQYPQRQRITSYLEFRERNRERGMVNWLDPTVTTLPALLQKAGYATGHFGKWHMGGQRDVTDAPPITAYGFDSSLTNFEGMGPKLLPLTERPGPEGGVVKGRIWQQAKNLGGPVEWRLRSTITSGFVDSALQFIDKAQKADKPFYLNLWPDDVHSPYFPSLPNWADSKRGLYLSVLTEMDRQFARLFGRIENDPELRDNTLILICSDNGPEPGAGSSAPLKGVKGTLYEGGIRSPLIVWSPKLLNADKRGTRNDSSYFSAIDLAPTLLSISQVPTPADLSFDGRNMASTLLGETRKSLPAPLFFRRPPDRENFDTFKNLPDLAVRDGNWKLLCDHGGKNPQLYNLAKDPGEKSNLAKKRSEITVDLTKKLLLWNATLPPDASNPDFKIQR